MGLISGINRLAMRTARWTASFDGARQRRRLAGWTPTGNSINTILAADGDLLRRRARDLVRNNPYARAGCDSFVTNLIGSGIKPSSLISDANTRKVLMQLWSDWVDEADADGLTDFYGIQAMVGRAVFEAGECFVRLRARRPEDGLIVPLQLQALESDMLPFSDNRTLTSGNIVVSGVEFDAIGRRVAYHFWRQHPGEKTYLPPTDGTLQVRVPASEVRHIYRVDRPGQIRGVPWAAPAIVRLWNFDQYDDAELDRKKTAAMFAGFIKNMNIDDHQKPEENPDDPSGRSAMVTLEPGTMWTLEPGEEVQFSQPSDVGGSYEMFQYRTLLAICAAMGVPYATTTGDLKRANYSSLRGGLLEFRRRIEQLQNLMMVPMFCAPIWRRWLSDAVISGAIRIPNFARDQRNLSRAKFIPPRFEWVDPEKERRAEKLAVDAGFKSRSDVIEQEGYDPEEVDARIKADQDRADQLGLRIGAAAEAPAPTTSAQDLQDLIDNQDAGDQAAA